MPDKSNHTSPVRRCLSKWANREMLPKPNIPGHNLSIYQVVGSTSVFIESAAAKLRKIIEVPALKLMLMD